MAFIIIETKQKISSYKYVILDLLGTNYKIVRIEESTNRLIIHHEPIKIDHYELFLNLAEELFIDIKVYYSDEIPKYEIEDIIEWFDAIEFRKTKIYDDHRLLLKRV